MNTIIKDTSGNEYVLILDTSAHQFAYIPPKSLKPGARKPNFTLAVNRGASGILHRIGNGINKDPAWEMVRAECERVKMPLGAYYYIQPNKLSAQKACDLIKQWLGDVKLQLPIMIDCEAYDGNPVPKAALAAYINDLGVALRTAYPGHPVIIYTFSAWWNSNVGTSWNSSYKYDAMVARYSRDAAIPPSTNQELQSWIPWNKPPTNTSLGAWDGWQFTSSADAIAYGYPTDGGARLDLNVVKRSVYESWLRQAGAVTPTQPPVVTEPITVPSVTVSAMNVGSTMNVSFNLVDNQSRLVDTREHPGAPIAAGGELVITKPSDVPADVVAYTFGVVAINTNAAAAGLLQVKSRNGTYSATSSGNYQAEMFSGEIIVPAQSNGDAVIKVVGSPAHIIVDIVGYYTPFVATNVVAPTTKTVTVVTGVTTESVQVIT